MLRYDANSAVLMMFMMKCPFCWYKYMSTFDDCFRSYITNLGYISKLVTVASSEVWLNTLWLSAVIWQQQSWSILVQVMAWCLMAPSHYLNQSCWLIISEVCGIHLRENSQEMPKISILDMSLKVTHLRLQPQLPGTNESLNWGLNYAGRWYFEMYFCERNNCIFIQTDQFILKFIPNWW